ncbi:MAG: copper amine oxidase N-terminal domain-containing protein [Clostridiales bacterium]|jgi:hypothetical protein|nr:copper amine oxidase N-terminal domain-containing protein [Clostridiales bacterium]
MFTFAKTAKSGRALAACAIAVATAIAARAVATASAATAAAARTIAAAALAAAMLVAFVPAPPAAAATGTAAATPITLGGSLASAPFTDIGDYGYGGEALFSFSPAEDGNYAFTFTRELTNGDDFEVFVFNKSGEKIATLGKATRRDLDKTYVLEKEAYLHSGKYYLQLVNGGNNMAPANVSASAVKAQSRFGEDKEPNESPETAMSLALGRSASGVIYGLRDTMKTATNEDLQRDIDWYVLDVPSETLATMSLECELRASIEIYDSSLTNRVINEQERSWYFATAESKLDQSYKGSWDVNFPDAGKYYIRVYITSRYNNTVEAGSYKLSLGGGGSGAAAGGAGAAPSQGVAASPIAAGIRIALPALTSGTGFRIYRDGAVIAELATGAAFVDVNVEPGKKYAYSVREVLAGGALGDESPAAEATAGGDILGGTGAGKGYILMAIDSPLMSVNGEEREIDPGRGTAPTLISDRTMVPIRAIVEAMGGVVGWDAGERKIDLAYGGRTVAMWLDSKDILADGAPKQMDVAPAIVNDRTLLPIRFAAENLGCEIEWIGSSREIVIVFFN